ncbi:MAG: IPExxxVDY family protein, partial [Flavobacteriaceae bacterium]|nr:IPExxxVDY family protein [Flavobacteriaceae bacterium]
DYLCEHKAPPMKHASRHSLSLDSFIPDEEIYVLALNSKREAFQMAMQVNRRLGICLQRSTTDYICSEQQSISYAVFEYENHDAGKALRLVENLVFQPELSKEAGLFQLAEWDKKYALFKEFANIQYLLISHGFTFNEVQIMLKKLKEIPGIPTVYPVEYQHLKNLNYIYNA